MFSGFRVQGLGLMFSGFRVQGLGLRALALRLEGSGFRVEGVSVQALVLRFRVHGSGFSLLPTARLGFPWLLPLRLRRQSAQGRSASYYIGGKGPNG